MASADGLTPTKPPTVDLSAVTENTLSLLQDHQQVVARRTDRLLAGLIVLQWIGALVITGLHWGGAPTSPAGLGTTIWINLGGGAVMVVLSVALTLAHAGRRATRHALAVSQVLMSILLGPLLSGHWDWHFHIFGTLAFLALYRDWRVLLSASAAALLIPLLGGLYSDGWGWTEQIGGVVAEDVLLLFYCRQTVREMRWLAERQSLLQATESIVGESFAERHSSEEALLAAHQRLALFHQEWEDGARLRAEELARANEALQRNNSALRAQQEATTDGILIVNEDRDVASYNHRFCELWQVPDGLMTADEDWTLLQHVMSRAKNPEVFRSLMARCYENPGEHARDEVELVDGRILERYTQPIFSDTDQYYGRVWYFRDVTDRKRAEAQIIGLNRELSHVNDAITQAYDATIEGWSRAMDLRDKETEGHCKRVTELAMRLAVAVGLCGEDLIQMRRGALLHDIGKMGVPDHILLKPGPLTEDEWQIMRLHPQYAYEMLAPISFLRPALDIPWCHHEKWDGTGYPCGLRGEQIPLSARVFALVDVWDALRSDRPYRKAWSKERVCDHIGSLAGTHFDPSIVPVFLSVIASEEDDAGDALFSAIELFSASETLTELPWAA